MSVNPCASSILGCPSPPFMDAVLDASARDLLGTLHEEATRTGALSSHDLSRRLYGDLRRLAQGHRARWSGYETVNTTALVHEAYLKLASGEYGDGDHFLNVASLAMRQVLVSYARERGAAKRGGNGRDVRLEDAPPDALLSAEAATDTLTLNDALARFAALDPRAARVVEMKVFAALRLDEISAALKVSEATVTRDWRRARAWLRRELGDLPSLAA